VVKADLTGLTFHGLRHSAAGLLIALGAPDPVLRERMGHSSNRVTRDVYRHVLPIVDDAVTTEIDRLFSDPSRTIAHETETAKLSQPRSSKLTRGNCSGGERTRTADFYVANVALYQLSYTPVEPKG
jgi:hypothetical protein